MLNDLNTLIGFEIELKIRDSIIYLQNLLPNYFILLQLYINSKLSFLGKITKLFNQCFLLGATPMFFHITFKYRSEEHTSELQSPC